MEHHERLFLEAMKAALLDQTVAWDGRVSPETLKQVLELAQMHHVLPMVFEAIYSCPAAAALDPGLVAECRQATLHAVMHQAVKTEEFFELYDILRQTGAPALVVKGLVCRNLYPRPDYRDSTDEDVFCGEQSFSICQEAMTKGGMEPYKGEQEDYEISYHKVDGTLHVELHKNLFQKNSEVFDDCNRFFDHSLEHPAWVTVDGRQIATLDYSENMLYLILHAYKHFLHSGFGIRQVCDMVLFANHYGAQIRWEEVRRNAGSLRVERFAGALFAIGEKYLTFDPEKACFPISWLEVDPEPLLQDLLCGGIYGAAQRSRMHSSNIMLNAVKANKKGKRGIKLLGAAFPSVDILKNRYRWLQKKPWLLPVAWGMRIFSYLKGAVTHKDSSAADVMRTGSQRVELLRFYDMID